MSDYSNGKIYALKCNETNDVYIGSTIRSLNKRLIEHRNDMKRYNEGKRSCVSSFEILKYPTCYIELLETYPCNNKEELLKKEREYIENMECVNKCIPFRTDEEKKEYHKEYNETNRDTIREQKKEWHETNREKRLERQKELYKANKDTIKEKYEKTRYTCVCGTSSTEKHRRRHEQSKKHTEYIKEIETNGDQKNISEFINNLATTHLDLLNNIASHISRNQ